jgi:hypothetical protein
MGWPLCTCLGCQRNLSAQLFPTEHSILTEGVVMMKIQSPDKDDQNQRYHIHPQERMRY